MKRMIVFDGYPWRVFGRIFVDVRQRGRDRGWLQALKFLPSRCLWSDVVHYERLNIFKRPIPSALLDKDVLIDGISYRLATSSDTANYEQLFKHPSNTNDHRRMLEAGDITVLALDGDKLVGIGLGSIWQDGVRPTETDFVILNRALKVDAGKDALIHRILVADDYRQHGIGGHLLKHLIHTLGDMGVQQAYSVVNTDSPEALHVFSNIGGELIGEMVSIQLLNLQHIRVSEPSHSEQA
jgi:GNAT superfamily N-acetyltransferase